MNLEVTIAPRFPTIRGHRFSGSPPPNFLLDSSSTRHSSMGTAGFCLLTRAEPLLLVSSEPCQHEASDSSGVWEVGEGVTCGSHWADMWPAECRLEVCWATCPQTAGAPRPSFIHPTEEREVQTLPDWRKKASRPQGALAGLGGQRDAGVISKERRRRVNYRAQPRPLRGASDRHLTQPREADAAAEKT